VFAHWQTPPARRPRVPRARVKEKERKRDRNPISKREIDKRKS
jgi:hypothetical protein